MCVSQCERSPSSSDTSKPTMSRSTTTETTSEAASASAGTTSGPPVPSSDDVSAMATSKKGTPLVDDDDDASPPTATANTNNKHTKEKKKGNTVVGTKTSSSKLGCINRKIRRGSSSSSFFTRTVILRICAFLSLVTAAGLCAGLTYVFMRKLEMQVGHETYESVAVLAIENAEANIQRKLKGQEAMTTIMSFAFPTAEDWPMAGLDGYTEINKAVADMSYSTEHALSVIVKPNQVQEFEAFAQQMYIDQGYPNYTGTSDFGFGIWKKDKENSPYEDGRVHDTEGSSAEFDDPENKFLLPIVHVAHKKSTFLLFNLHSTSYAPGVDSILKCVRDAVNSNSTVHMPPCGLMTDILSLVHRDGPAAVIRRPIFPKKDPNTVVGLISVTVFWEDILKNIVADYVDGLLAVISTDTQTFTFEVQQGIPVLLGEGDLHDEAQDDFAHTTVLGHMETGVENVMTATYKLTIYPTDRVFAYYTTRNPMAIAVGFVGVIAICTIIFIIYDCLMRYEVFQKAQVLEMKRRFIRFISHEIRTPLNTVCVGLELLSGEVSLPDQEGPKESLTREEVAFCSSVIADVRKNSITAVDVLNDILNYDKIESGTLQLEIEAVNIWKLIESTVSQFQIQAQNFNVALMLAVKTTEEEQTKDIEATKNDDCFATRVVGDPVRLGQVLRNIISNALKFTPPNGTIDVTATHLPGELAQIDPITDNRDVPHTLATSHPRGGAIQIHFKDSGVGMTKSQLKMLFSEGVQFDANKLQHGGGSGLGLAISKGIVEQHRGTIIAESDGSGHGTEFTITLPLYEFSDSEILEERNEGMSMDNSPPPKIAAGVIIENQESPPSGNHDGQVVVPAAGNTGAASAKVPPQLAMPLTPKRRVLVVEDALPNIKMLVRLLERSGHSCDTAVNGAISIDAIVKDMALAKEKGQEHVPFDTILMDFEMPVMDGPAATKQIRELGYSGTILGVTGNMLQEDIDYFTSMGADRVLGKPISMKSLNASWKDYPITEDPSKIYSC